MRLAFEWKILHYSQCMPNVVSLLTVQENDQLKTCDITFHVHSTAIRKISFRTCIVHP
jgi:hypothetical protein